MNLPSSRRMWLMRVTGAALALPLATLATRAYASKNEALRTALKYQDKPNGDQHCATCMHFVPGKTATALGSCKVIPGDTEISPNGWCTAYLKKA